MNGKDTPMANDETITVALDRLSKERSALDEKVQLLIERISLACAASDVDQMAPKLDESMTIRRQPSPIQSHILDEIHNIATIRLKVQDTLNRLDL